MNVQGTLGEYGNILLQSELEHNRAFMFNAMREPWLVRRGALKFYKAMLCENIMHSLNQRFTIWNLKWILCTMNVAGLTDVCKDPKSKYLKCNKSENIYESGQILLAKT